MFDTEKLAKMEARVQKLIAQAEGTDNQDEAAAFMAAAEELMVRYSIDRAKLEADTGTRDEFVREYFVYPHAAMYWATDKISANVITSAIGLCGIAVLNSHKYIYLYGTKQDVEYTKSVILSVWKQQRRHMRLWKKNNPHIKMLAGADLRNMEKGFYLGFARGAGEKITESRETVELSSDGGALVLASRMNDISDFMSGSGVINRRAGRKVNYSGAGYGEGHTRGRNASLGAELSGARRTISR